MKTSTNQLSTTLFTNVTAASVHNGSWLLTNKWFQRMRWVSGGLALSLCYCALATTQALAANFSFTKIADTRSDFSFVSRTVAINDSGTVAFSAIPVGFVDSRYTGLSTYTSNGVKITEVVNQNRLPSPYNIPTFADSSSSVGSIGDINNDGSVAFLPRRQSLNSSETSIVTTAGNSLTTRGSGFDRNFRVGNSAQTINDYVFNDRSELAYLIRNVIPSNNVDNFQVVLTRINQPDIIVASALPIVSPDSPVDTPFSSINAIGINNFGEVIFAATNRDSGTTGIYTSIGDSLNSLVDTPASALSVNDSGDIFISSGDAIRLFNRTSGILETSADTSSGQFRRFTAPAINNNGNIAFQATLNAGQTGIFTGASPTTDKVIATGDTLFGSSVTNLNFLRSGLNNNGQIAFFAQLADGTQGVFRAEVGVETPQLQPLPQTEGAFSLSKIVDTSTPVPGGSGNFTSFDGSLSSVGGSLSSLNRLLIEGDQVVFRGLASGGEQGIYTSRGGVLDVVVDKNTAIPGGSGTFSSIGNSFFIDSSDNVVFTGSNNNQGGIYRRRGDTLEVVADRNTPISGGRGNYTGSTFIQVDENNVAFGTFLGGIYISREGQLQVVADKSTPVPNGTGIFSEFRSLFLDGNNVAFLALSAARGFGIYVTREGTLQVLVDRNTPGINYTPTFSSAFSILAFDNNNVVFSTLFAPEKIYISRDGNLQELNTTLLSNGIEQSINLSGVLGINGNDVVLFSGNPNGIYKSSDGFLQVLVDTNTTVPNRTIKFDWITNPVVNGDNFAFVGRANGLQGIYASIGGELLKVAELDDLLDGTQISLLNLSALALSGSSLAFEASFIDGSKAFVRADLISSRLSQSVPEGGSTLGLLAFGVLGASMCQVRKRSHSQCS